MKVQELMTQSLRTVRPQDPLATAARHMWEGDCGALPVVDEQAQVLGMITDRDICMAAYTRGVSLGEIPVGSVMSREVRACRFGDSLETAEKLMRRHQVRRIPVLDNQGKLVGLLSLNDLARAARERSELDPEETATTLAAISEPHAAAAAAAAARPRAAVASARPRPAARKPAKKTR